MSSSANALEAAILAQPGQDLVRPMHPWGGGMVEEGGERGVGRESGDGGVGGGWWSGGRMVEWGEEWWRGGGWGVGRGGGGGGGGRGRGRGKKLVAFIQL